MVKVLPMGMGYSNLDGRFSGFGSGIFGRLRFGLKYNSGQAIEYIKSGVCMLGIQQTKQLGRSCGFGHVRFGVTWFGDDNFFSGVYQKRVTGYNNTGRIPGLKRESYYVRMRTYRPSNPRSVKQTEKRTIFAGVVADWPLLTKNEKMIYSRRGVKFNRTGRSQFISEELKIRYQENN